MSSVKSALRVLEILEGFAEAGHSLRLKDVATRLGYPISSTAALLKSLSEYGYLSFDRTSRHYFPSSRISELGSRLASSAIENGILIEAMNALLRETGELVVAGTPNDIHIEYVKALRSTQDIQLYSPSGTRYLMVQSGMGTLLLSRMEDSVALRIYRRTVAAGQLDPAAFSEANLLARIRKARESDYVFTRASDYVTATGHKGGAMIAMLVPTPANYRPLALGVGGPAARLKANMAVTLQHMRIEIERIADVVTGSVPIPRLPQ